MRSSRLLRLTAPVAGNHAEIATGFSWMLVKDGQLSSHVLAAMAAISAVVTLVLVFRRRA